MKVTYYEDQTIPIVLGVIELQEAMLVRITPPSSHLHQALNLWKYVSGSWFSRLIFLSLRLSLLQSQSLLPD